MFLFLKMENLFLFVAYSTVTFKQDNYSITKIKRVKLSSKDMELKLKNERACNSRCIYERKIKTLENVKWDLLCLHCFHRLCQETVCNNNGSTQL
jgi:hypothetical protein